MTLITEKCLRHLLSQQKLPNEFLLQSGDKLTPAAKDFLVDRKIPITQSKNSSKAKEISYGLTIPVGVSNRHVHLMKEHFLTLFGTDAQLTNHHPLSQPNQFAANETVTLVGPKGVIQNVRILGPFRKYTQIEISKTDGFTIGVHPPVRISGSIEGTPGVTMVGPVGSVTIEEGVIIAKNHIHMSPAEAKNFNVKDGDSLIVSSSNRSIIFHDVVVRVKDSYLLDFHIDYDEANAANLFSKDVVKVIGKNQKLFSIELGGVWDG